MIIYTKDKKLITTDIGNLYNNIDLAIFASEAESFRGKENKYFKIISEETVNRSFKHITRESRANEARRKIREITNHYEYNEYYNKEENIGYSVFPYRKKPTIYIYQMIYPAITEFFRYWNKFNSTGISKKHIIPHYDLSNLIKSIDNFKDLECIFTKQEGEILKKTLYNEFPEFAMFYYEIYPHLNINITGNYDISKLINAKLLVCELGLDTRELDAMLENLKVAENNTKVLKLINNSK